MLWRGLSADSNAFGPARPTRCKFAKSDEQNRAPPSYTMGTNGNPLALHSMASSPAKVSTSCFAASVALPAPDLALQLSESETNLKAPTDLS